MNMNDYILGSDLCTVAGSGDWGKPAVVKDWGEPAMIDDPSWGVPVDVSGGGGGGHGGHHGGGHHGGGWGGMHSHPLDGYWAGVFPLYEEVDASCEYITPDGQCVDIVDVIGGFDINVEQRKMNTLKQVPVSVAQALLHGGQSAITGAISRAGTSNLPGVNARNTVQGKLSWHAAALAPLMGSPNAIYSSGEDLKHWVMQAFIEYNAVEEGSEALSAAWSNMWSEIGAAIVALPAEIRKVTGDVVKNITGLPLWAWVCVGIGVVVLVGGIVYVLINSKAGAAVVGIAAKTYMR